MDFMKVLDQTVRELKREVNKTILKVPEIEQKVLDATSNEPWGPHGTLMAEIAQATRNHYDLQMIMTILWKRISDTGRNWRHVYKALTVMEYLVAHGSERVIDDIKEHAYQIAVLADFDYVEPNGKDQGINVRKKAKTLMAVVNDKEKIREVRQKAADNRDKYRGVSSMGGITKSGSYQSTGGSYGGDRYAEDNRHGLRDDDGYRYRDDDLYGRESERSSRASDRYKDHHNRDHDDNADYYSSRKGDDQYSDKHTGFENDARREHRDSENHLSRRPVQKPSVTGSVPGPPGYEEASQNPEYHSAGQQRELKPSAGQFMGPSSASAPMTNLDSDDFDDFNPRATSATVAAPSQLGDMFNQSEQNPAVRGSSPSPVASNLFGDTNDLFGESVSSSGASLSPLNLGEDLFGNSPFKVEASGSSSSTAAQATIKPPPNYAPPSTGNGIKASVPHNAEILPTSVKQPPNFPTGNVAATAAFDAFAPAASSENHAANVAFGGDDFFGLDTSGVSGTVSSSARELASTLNALQPPPAISGAFQPSQSFATSASSNPSQPYLGTSGQGQPGNTKLPQEKRFETKSAVWAESLSKGLIDLNLTGPKSNPLADIGIDFDQLRTERIKDERMTTGKSTAGMGRAMGSGSGLGVAGASALVTPAAPVALNNMGIPPMMGMGMRMGGTGMGTGIGPMMQMGLNPGLAVRPGTGMGPTPGLGIGMGVNSTATGFPNQQQQYGGFR